jgi:hypothetical protein
MIPKKIHYCWFGGNKKNDLIERCIKSWREKCPDYEIIEWNEQNFDVEQHLFTKEMYAQKKWAFVADYVRFSVLEKDGGWYLDTDMELMQSLDLVSSHRVVLGEEATGQISAGAIGAERHHPYIVLCKEYYDNYKGDLMTSPKVMSTVYKNFPDKLSIKVLEPIVFYPYSQQNISEFRKEDLSFKTIGVHFWDYSWGNPTLRKLNKMSAYHSAKKLLDILHIKAFLKKVLGLAKT